MVKFLTWPLKEVKDWRTPEEPSLLYLYSPCLCSNNKLLLWTGTILVAAAVPSHSRINSSPLLLTQITFFSQPLTFSQNGLWKAPNDWVSGVHQSSTAFSPCLMYTPSRIWCMYEWPTLSNQRIYSVSAAQSINSFFSGGVTVVRPLIHWFIHRSLFSPIKPDFFQSFTFTRTIHSTQVSRYS